MEVREAQAIAGKLVKVRRPDLAAKAAQIAETQVIRYNDQEVWSLLLSASGSVCTL